MGRWTRYRLRIVVGLVLMGLVCVFRFLPAPERGNGLTTLTIGLALVTTVHLLGQESGRRSADSRPVDVLATKLAQEVYGQWRKAAGERRLVMPAPIPIRWSPSNLDVPGSLPAAVGAPDMAPAFPPLPGHAMITEEDLRAGGGRRELHQLFAGLASGRIVVVGAPGAGKSGAAILLVLDTLAHRRSLDDTERARVPVPVLFTGQGWDPNTTSVRDWLRDKLVETYSSFQRRGGDADAATLIAAPDKIALILDGLDEMDKALRPAALQALNDAPFRVVVLTRDEKMIEGEKMIAAASESWLVGAVAVRLHDVTGPQAADYLERARVGPVPAGWPSLLAQLREQPDGVLARGLSTPLPLTLLRDTYQAGDDELLGATRSTEAIKQRLIARVLPAAYAPRPGRPAPRYSEEQARQTLTCIARKMGNERDLAWWRIPDWAPVTPRILATGLVFGLVSGLGVALGNGLAVGLMYRLVFGLMYWLVFGIMTWLMIGFVLGLGFGFGFGFGPRVGLGVAAGLGVGLGIGLMYRVGGGEPRRLRIASWRAAISRQVLRKGLVLGTGCGLVIGLGYGFAYELGIGLRAGVIAGLLLWLAYILLNMFFQGGTSESSPLGPDKIWRNDRMVGLRAGLLAGLVAGCGCWFVAGLVAERGFGVVLGLWVALVFGLASGLVGLGVGVGVALTYPAIWQTTLAWRQLRRCGHVPAVSLMPFLEDAHKRGVLRIVGGVYQFRHATLQDQLANQTTASSAASRVS